MKIVAKNFVGMLLVAFLMAMIIPLEPVLAATKITHSRIKNVQVGERIKVVAIVKNETGVDIVRIYFRSAELKTALEPIGFNHTGRPRLSVFEDPKTRWYIEFLLAPLSFGSTYADPSQCAQVEIGLGALRIITPTQSVMDRPIAATAWNKQQSLEQALLVAEYQH